MDQTKKDKILNLRKLLQKNAPHVYNRYSAYKLSKRDKEADNKPQPMA